MNYFLAHIASDANSSHDRDDVLEDGTIADDIACRASVEDGPYVFNGVLALGEDLLEQHDPVVEVHTKVVEHSILSRPSWMGTRCFLSMVIVQYGW